MKRLAWALAAALLFGLAATGLVVVEETEHVVVTQFGRPVAVLSSAGPTWKLPAPLQRATRLEKRRLLTETREAEFLTADKKNVVASLFLSWRIQDPLRFLGALRTREAAEERLVALAQSALGGALGEVAFTALVPAETASASQLPALESRVLAETAPVAARDFGIELIALGVTRLGYPAQNLESVFARMRAERERIAKGYRSEGEAEARKIRAEADRDKAQTIAAAESQAARLLGQGEAEAARIYAEAYKGHEDLYRFLRTLAAYEKVLGDNTTLVLPADSPFLDLLLRRGGKGVAPGEGVRGR